MHSSAFVVLTHSLQPTCRAADFQTAAPGLVMILFELEIVSLEPCHARFKWHLHLYLLMFTFVYHHHFISGMGTTVTSPSHALSRCSSSPQQQLSAWKKGFVRSITLPWWAPGAPGSTGLEFQNRYSIDCSSLDLLKLRSALQL